MTELSVLDIRVGNDLFLDPQGECHQKAPMIQSHTLLGVNSDPVLGKAIENGHKKKTQSLVSWKEIHEFENLQLTTLEQGGVQDDLDHSRSPWEEN